MRKLEKFNIRVIEDKGELWYSAKDLGREIGLTNIRCNINNQLGEEDRRLFNSKKDISLSNRGENFISKNGVKILISKCEKCVSKELIEHFGIEQFKPQIVRFENVFEQELQFAMENLKDEYFNDLIFNPNTHSNYNDIFYFKSQYSIGKYKLDFFFEETGLIIEYDEQHHSKIREKEKDKAREREVKALLERKFDNTIENMEQAYEIVDNGESFYKFIRIKKGEEKTGVYRIISYLLRAIIY